MKNRLSWCPNPWRRRLYGAEHPLQLSPEQLRQALRTGGPLLDEQPQPLTYSFASVARLNSRQALFKQAAYNSWGWLSRAFARPRVLRVQVPVSECAIMQIRGPGLTWIESLVFSSNKLNCLLPEQPALAVLNPSIQQAFWWQRKEVRGESQSELAPFGQQHLGKASDTFWGVILVGAGYKGGGTQEGGEGNHTFWS